MGAYSTKPIFGLCRQKANNMFTPVVIYWLGIESGFLAKR